VESNVAKCNAEIKEKESQITDAQTQKANAESRLSELENDMKEKGVEKEN
jgi:hypothetical protein